MMAGAISFSLEKVNIDINWAGIGLVAAIVIIAFLLWFFLRKRR